ncbi:hypothetical protein Tco_1391577 [Tanacetum coccineum]
MLAMNRMIGALLLKLGIGCLGLRSRFLAWWGKVEHDHETVHPRSWNRPINYDPTPYVLNITTCSSYDTRHPPSYTSILNPIRHLVHRLLTLSVAGRHSGKEKVTLDDLFLLHSMDGGVSVDVLWHVAKFLYDNAKGSKRKSLIVMVWVLVRWLLRSLRFLGTMMMEPDRLRLGELDATPTCPMLIGMTSSMECLDSGKLSMKGVNFMSGTPGYSTAASPSTSQFGMFGDAHPSTSCNQDNMNED